MHQPPHKKTEQSAATVLEDLKRQKEMLEDSTKWLENISAAILKMSGTVRYFNRTVITPTSRMVEIALLVPIEGKEQPERITVFTINCSYTDKEISDALKDPFKSHTALTAHRNQVLLDAYGSRQFDVWLVKETHIWQDGERETIAWLNRQVKQWFSYWFKKDINAVFDKTDLGVTYLGVRPLPQS